MALLTSPPGAMWAGVAAGAVAVRLFQWLLLQAYGLPALQALAASAMLASTVAASFAWPCSGLTAATAAVPLACAGK